MGLSKKTKYSFLAFFVSLGLVSCSDTPIDPTPIGPSSPKYLLNGVLSNETDSNGFSYYINGDEAYVARGINTSTTPEIPSSVVLGGKTYDVTGIYHSGFAKADITSISLPLSITTIDYQAFAYSSLQSAVIPCNVTQMGSGAFMNCYSLTAVQFKNDDSTGSSVIGVCGAQPEEEGGEATGSSHLSTIPDYCFFNCSSLTAVAFPKSLRTVDTCGFSSCTALTKIAFLPGFTTLKKYALESCSALTDLYLPGSFTGIDTAPNNCEEGALFKVGSNCIIHLTADNTTFNKWKNWKPWRYLGNGSNPISDGKLSQETADVGTSGDYLYRIEDGGATLFSYAPSSAPEGGVIVMPNDFNGIPVRKAEAATYASFKSVATQIYLSKNLVEIADGFFADMDKLTTVSSTQEGCYTPLVDPIIDLSRMDKLTLIGQELFKINIKDLKTYMQDTFNGLIKLPTKALTEIKKGAFRDLKKAAGIEFVDDDSKLQTIGESAFQNVGWNRYSGNNGDDKSVSSFSLTLPATCTSVGKSAFQNVLGLKKIEFKGASSQRTLAIGESAFQYCRSLCEIIFPTESNTSVTIGQKAFYACSSGNGKGFLYIPGIEEVFIPSTVTSIGSKAFAVNERACFFFEAANPANVASDFNEVFYEKTGTEDNTLHSIKDNNYIGIRENNGVYYNVGFNNGNDTSKKRYIQTDDFCFVETSDSDKQNERGKFICARYRYDPTKFNKDTYANPTVPGYIKYKSQHEKPYEGESGTSSDFEVVSIGPSCFSSCISYRSGDSRGKKGLSSVKIPDTIRKIGDNAFLRSIFFNELTAYTSEGNRDQYTFPSKLEYIGRSAFACTRLVKALGIPRDVVTFDMLSLDIITDANKFPASIVKIDGLKPKVYAESSVPAGRYSSIFANDWLLQKVDFGDPVVETAEATMSFDPDTNETKHTLSLYALKEVGQDGKKTAKKQLLMICGRLKDSFGGVYSTVHEGKNDHVDYQEMNIAIESGTSSVRYGAWRMANWAQRLTLNADIDLFPTFSDNYGERPIPQAILTAAVNLTSTMLIGGTGNDADYIVKTQAIDFVGDNAETDLALPEGFLRNAKNVTSMTFPESLTSIPNNAFDRAAGISQWYTPPGTQQDPVLGGERGGEQVLDLRHNTKLVYIGTSAFWGSKGIRELYLPSSLTALGSQTGGDVRSSFEEKDKDPWEEDPLALVDLSQTQLTTLPQRSFQGHRSLAEVRFPAGLTSIGANCFNACNIQLLNLPDQVTKLDGQAFGNNEGMTIARLPVKLASLSDTTFSGCTSLNQVYFSKVHWAQNEENYRAKGSYTLPNKCFPANVKYAMLPQFINDGGGSQPFYNCTDLRAIFYGASINEASANTTFFFYKSATLRAPIYYYADTSNLPDNPPNGAKYWQQKDGAPHIAQVMTYDSENHAFSATGEEFDFSKFLTQAVS